MIKKTRVNIRSNEEESWDTFWNWKWFKKDVWKSNFRNEEDIIENRRVFATLLSELNVKSVLDCACGMGRKTIVLAEMGYEVDGCDSSAVAVECARQLTNEEGLKIKFFQSRWEELGKRCSRKYDCAFNDAFNWITSRKALLESAKGIHSVLKDNGKFIFFGSHQWANDVDKEKIIEEEWNNIQRFDFEPVYEKDRTRLAELCVYDRTSDGILANNVFMIEESGETRVEVTSTPHFYHKWNWNDYVDVLKEAGFSDIHSIRIKGIPDKVHHVPNIGVK
jgi:SAM-dependent methyltransferase